MSIRATPLETIWVTVPEHAVEAYEQALALACDTIGFFQIDEARAIWRVEGVRPRGANDAALEGALAIAAAVSGHATPLERIETEAEGWLARTASAFPEQRVGRRFAIRGTHLAPQNRAGIITLRLDAGIAFGSGEHNSTRGCLIALERVAHRRPRRILDLGCGSAVLAMAAASLLGRRVHAVDIEPWSVRVAAQNARLNGLHTKVHATHGNGWHAAAARTGASWDLVFANILARPLCRMAADLARRLTPGGTAILAGLLQSQARMVLASHRRQGLVLERRLDLGEWTTLVLRKPARSAGARPDRLSL